MGGALALDAAWLFAAFLIILVLAAAGIASRRFLLERGGGTVECGLRRVPNGSWRLGVASYQREELNWFGALGLTMRPDVVFPRRDLTVVSRRLPTEAGPAPDGFDPAPGPGAGIGPGGTVELAMGEEALTGLLAWLEAGPPGSHFGVAL